MRTIIADLIRTIPPHDTLEAQQIAHTLDWIASAAPLFRIQKPATPAQHLVSYFVLFDQKAGKILLVDHKNAGLWLPAGGHVEIDEHPRATVEREIQEELQITANFLRSEPFFLTVTETVGNTLKHVDVSLWFVLQGDSNQALPFDSGEFHQIRWFSLDQLPLERCDPHLQRFCQKLSDEITTKTKVHKEYTKKSQY